MRMGRSSLFSSFLKSFGKIWDLLFFMQISTANKIKCNYIIKNSKNLVHFMTFRLSVKLLHLCLAVKSHVKYFDTRGSGPMLVSAHRLQELWYFIEIPYSAQSACSQGVWEDEKSQDRCSLNQRLVKPLRLSPVLGWQVASESAGGFW